MKKIFIYAALACLAASCGGGPDRGGRLRPLNEVIDSALTSARNQYLLLAEKYAGQQERLPRSFEQGMDIPSDSRWWTSGFFPGSLWYLYENSGDGQILEYARMFTDRVEGEKYTTDNHDVGFMLYCSFGNGLRLTGDEQYAEVLLTGARSLATRFDPRVGLIRSWDHNGQVWQYPVIIDNMMNLELLLWAAAYGDDPALKEIALSHADKTLEHHYRPDNSCWHVVSYDTATGSPHLKQTHQGYADHSVWSRGQAWGLYGYTLMFRETGDQRYLRQAENIADFMIGHPRMPEDYIPYWDFDAPDIPDAPRDASAAAIMASALVELSGYVDGPSADRYLRVAETQVRTLASPLYTAPPGENGGFILMHGVGALPLGSEVDVPLTYADYYYLEAITRFKRILEGAGD